MFEVYLGFDLVFEGNREEMEEFCKTHEHDLVLDKGMVEYEKMISQGYTWDSYFDHYDYY